MLLYRRNGPNIGSGWGGVKAEFHVKPIERFTGNSPAPLELGHAPAPARRLDHEIVQVTRRDARNARRLRQRRRADAIQLLSCLGRETLELEVGKLQGEPECGELG